jgi:hypothetical protein
MKNTSLDELKQNVRNSIPDALEKAKDVLIESANEYYDRIKEEYPGSIGYLIAMQTVVNEEKVLASIKSELGDTYKHLHNALTEEYKEKPDKADIVQKETDKLIVDKLKETRLSTLAIQQMAWGFLPAEHTNIKNIDLIQKSEDSVFQDTVEKFLTEEIREGITYEGMVTRTLKQGMEYHGRLSLFYKLNATSYPYEAALKTLKDNKSQWIENSKGTMEHGTRQKLLGALLPLFPNQLAILTRVIVPAKEQLQHINRETLSNELRNIWKQSEDKDWTPQYLYSLCAGKLFSYAERDQRIQELCQTATLTDIKIELDTSDLAKRISYANKMPTLQTDALLRAEFTIDTLRNITNPKKGLVDVKALNDLLCRAITDPTQEQSTLRSYKHKNRPSLSDQHYGDKLAAFNARKTEQATTHAASQESKGQGRYNTLTRQRAQSTLEKPINPISRNLSLSSTYEESEIVTLIRPKRPTRPAPSLTVSPTPPPRPTTEPSLTLSDIQKEITIVTSETLTLSRSTAQRNGAPKPLPRRPSPPHSVPEQEKKTSGAISLPAATQQVEMAAPSIRVEKPTPAQNSWEQRTQTNRPSSSTTRPRSISSVTADGPSSVVNLRERFERLIKENPAPEARGNRRD